MTDDEIKEKALAASETEEMKEFYEDVDQRDRSTFLSWADLFKDEDND